jgi:hypothetical protein
MNRIGIAAAFAALLATPALHAGDGTIASLVDISGNVLVSRDFEIASATEPVRLAPGTRVLVTLDSAAVLVYDDGRRVRLSGGERILVGEGPCRVDRFDSLDAIVAAPRK